MSTGGGLLDLVARGKKDTFFTQNPKISFFHSVYQRSPAFTQEVRLTQPRNRPEWGKWVDFYVHQRKDGQAVLYLAHNTELQDETNYIEVLSTDEAQKFVDYWEAAIIREHPDVKLSDYGLMDPRDLG